MANFFAPRPAAQQEVVPVQIMPGQQKILDAIGPAIGPCDYVRLFKVVVEVEEIVSPDPALSRLMHRGDAESDGIDLLAQLPLRVLKSLLSNTWTQRAANTDGVDGAPLRPTTTFEGAAHDPAIYAQIIKPRNGIGAPIDDFEKLLAMMEASVGLVSDSQALLGWNPEQCQRKIERAYTGLFNRRQGFFESIQSKMDTLKKNVEQYVTVQREKVIPRARAQGVRYIALHAEVGLAQHAQKRCEQHANMQSSPPLFKLLQLAARVVWPELDFRLHQRVVFNITSASQSEIGEPLGSVLCSAYIAFGGVNTEQAGIQLGGAGTISHNAWLVVADQFTRRKCLEWVQTNLDAWMESIRLQREDFEDSQRQHDRNAQFDRMARDNEGTLRKLDAKIVEIDEIQAGTNENLDKLEDMIRDERGFMADLLASTRKFNDSLKALSSEGGVEEGGVEEDGEEEGEEEGE